MRAGETTKCLFEVLIYSVEMTEREIMDVIQHAMNLERARKNDELIKLSAARRRYKDFIDWKKISIYIRPNSRTRYIRTLDVETAIEARNLSKIFVKY